MSVRNCSSDLCDVQWRPGAWRPCTVVCGSGFQSRRMDCVHRRSARTLADQHCAWLQRPSTWQHCNNTSCGSKCLHVPPSYSLSLNPNSSSLFSCRWMQGHHPVLQCGEETEAVLCGYVQTEMLWVMFTGCRLHLVAVCSYSHIYFVRWPTWDWIKTEIICELMLQELHICKQTSVKFFPFLKGNSMSLKRMEGRGASFSDLDPPSWYKMFTMWIKWSFWTFLQKQNILFSMTFERGGLAKNEYNDVVYCRMHSTALL